MSTNSTRVSQHINASCEKVYRVLIDPSMIAKWRVPNGMIMRVHSFVPREGGKLRISLDYADSTSKGKTSAHTDTYHGRFVKLVPNEQIVEVDEFETDDPALAGKMTVTITLVKADEGTDVIGVHQGLPRGVSIADNEMGWRMAFAKLAEVVEDGESVGRRKA
jgi:uncharacterized protein YndB with AHSA1/START domain